MTYPECSGAELGLFGQLDISIEQVLVSPNSTVLPTGQSVNRR